MSERSNRLNLFTSATMRLTAWYVLLLMTVSFLFSVVVYSIGASEFNHAFGPARPGEMRLLVDDDIVVPARQKRIEESSRRLIVSLVVFNLAVLVGGTALSYVLARRTLRPIEEAHEAQSRFASDAAHELRTPLAVMQTEIEVTLRDKKATIEAQRDALISTLEEVARLRTLTDRLLLLASQQELSMSEVDIELAVVEAVTHAIPLAQGKKIQIDNRVGGGKAVAHTESVGDILNILLDNAIKYSPAKSTVTLTSFEDDHSVVIQVQDQGPGVAKDEHEKIFERFYRSDISRSKENVEGHGLGLSLAKRLAREMRGDVTVESDGKNGSIFRLTLPT